MDNKLLIITATHGDEDLGVNLMKKLEIELSPKEYGYDWIIGNPKAYKKNVRFFQKDLNRSAPGSPRGNIYEEKRASEIVKLSKQYNFAVDLHGSVSRCGIITIITYPTLQNLVLASSLDVEKRVIWYSKSSLTSGGPLTQFMKCPSVEIECGPIGDPNTEKGLKNTLIRFITRIKDGSLSKKLKPNEDDDFYVVYGKKVGKQNQEFADFQKMRQVKETFYPFLANQYPNILCYKTKKVNIKDYFLY